MTIVISAVIFSQTQVILDWESIRSSPRDGFGNFGFWGPQIENDVPVEDGGLLQVLPLTVHMNFDRQVGGTILKLSYFQNFFVGPLLHA